MHEHVRTSDGRRLEVRVTGPEDGYPLFFHYGTPSAAVPHPAVEDAAARVGLRMVTCSRPGYGASSPRSEADRPGRVADDVADAVTVLDALDLDDFVTLGWSGGGPRALGCAALLSGRCRAAATLAGVAPYGVPGLDWAAGMGPENVRDFEAALRGRRVLEPLVAAEVEKLRDVTADQVAAAFGELVDDVDVAALTGEFAEYMAADLRRSCAQGTVGLLDDNLALVAPWGFELAEITVPVSVWQGRHDKMVPFGHGVWIADHVPGARRHLFDDEGHLSLVSRVPQMLAELREMAGLGPPATSER